MPSVKGQVEKIYYKQITNPTPQDIQYQSAYKVSIIIDGEWYSVGNAKKEIVDGFYIKMNTFMNTGDTIEAEYSENGDFKNVDKKTIKVLKKLTKDEKEAYLESKSPKSSPSFIPGASSIGPIVGQCINLAVQTKMVKSLDELANPDKAKEIVELYNKAVSAMTAAYTQSAPTPKEEKKEAPTQSQEDDDYEEDVPF